MYELCKSTMKHRIPFVNDTNLAINGGPTSDSSQ